MNWPLHIVLSIAHVAGLLLFLRGFFPSKVVLPGTNSFEGPSPFIQNGGAKFDKFVLMVVDAMRSDFCFSDKSEMTFLHSLINKGKAVPFTAFSNPPTVTLPRLKGITTGGAPSFLDAIINVADNSEGLSGDSWIEQFVNGSSKRSINFFGDDTWLKLFPDTFAEFEGTNSFFVSDFTEVDNNVTKHLDSQLQSPWDGLILHYLGLDHIGHKGGPDSVFMKPKQREMDDILKRLYDSVDDKTLIVFMGDHGMTEGGNHGGSSSGETNAALTFISRKAFDKLDRVTAPLPWNQEYSYYDKINQIDLVPTLAALLSFPIPKNNLGVMIPSFLPLWPKNLHFSILRENCRQFMGLFVGKYGEKYSGKHKEIYDGWEIVEDAKTSKTKSSKNDTIPLLLNKIQSILSESATNYNYDDIKYGYILILVSATLLVIFFTHYFIQQSKPLTFGFLFFTLAYATHFHGSSLIEEEHQIWWFLSITSAVLFAYNYRMLNWYTLALFAGLRLVRAWGNSGQKYSSETASTYLLANPSFLWVLISLTYVFYGTSIFYQGGINSIRGTNLVSFVIIFICISLSISFKLCQYFNDGREVPVWIRWYFEWILASFDVDVSTDKFQLQSVNVQLSQLTTIFIVGLLISRLIIGQRIPGKITDISNISTIYLIHQSRFEVIPIFLVFFLVKYSFTKSLTKLDLQNKIDNLLLVSSVFVICIQNLSFFSVGNTNLLATVDLSNAYNGIKVYDVGLVGLQTFMSNFSVVIYWSISSLQIIFELEEITKDKHNTLDLSVLKRKILLVKSAVSLVFYSVSAVSLIGSCIHLRFHLFIWTVFLPKLLYFGAWSAFVGIAIDLILAELII